MTDVPMQVALAEIRGELKTIATKLEAGDEASAHLFELLKEQLVTSETRSTNSRQPFRQSVTTVGRW